MARSQNDGADEFHFKHRSCSIILKKGDLLAETDTDILVIPTPASNEPASDHFVLYKAISSNSDEDYKRDIRRVRSHIKSGQPEIISKNGRGYILVVAPYMHNREKAHGLLKKTYTSCLELAATNNFRKIAFPTIGCGDSGFGTIDAARCIYSAIEHFGQSKDGGKMNEIKIVIYSDHVWTDFINSFMESTSLKDTKIKFIEVLPTKSNSTEMSANKGTRQTPQPDYEDDFEAPRGENQRGGVKKQTSNLNPDSPEYQPTQNSQDRVLRRYMLSNQRTELHIFQGDILKIKVDAIVNAANEHMTGGSGVDGAIHKAAGNELMRACRVHKEIYPGVRLPTGRSRILLSYEMSKTTNYIINTAGPRYDDAPPEKCEKDLTSCYKTSLALANLYDLETVAFTAISCGIFGYPIDKGAEVALKTVDSDADSMKRIYFVLKDDKIYDAWIQKAEELKFTSLDNISVAKTSIARQSSSNTRQTTGKPNENDESTVARPASSLKIIDASTSRDIKGPTDPDGDKLAPGSDGTPDGQGDTKGKDDTVLDENDETKPESEKGNPLDSPSKKKQAQNKDQKPPTSPIHKSTGKPLISSGGAGRGKNSPK